MNFTPFSSAAAVGGATHFVTTSGLQGQVGKFQQALGHGQVMSVVQDGGVQYVRTLEGGAALQQNAPQVITLPIALPGAKPGDPQQTMQIQVLSPNMLQQGVQQPKYMQIPIQGFQQAGGVGAVLTVAYSNDNVDGLQLLGSVPEGTFRNRAGMQVVATLQQDMQLIQHSDKEQPAILIPNNQPVVQLAEKANNNNNNNNVKIKQECDNDTNDDESSVGGESNSEGGVSWQVNANQEIANYLSKIPAQVQQGLPVSLQQYLRLNPDCVLKREIELVEDDGEDKQDAMEDDNALLKPKKKKKYKKRPLKPPRPKPGQVQIAQAADGTPIFCCPECHLAYPEKEQLELHLSVHKIERRFICGICGAGLKRKEHLERHKLGHNPERPYVCGVCNKGFKRKEHLNLHAVIHSGEKTEICQECGKGFYRKDHLRKHARSHQSRRAREEGAELACLAPAASTPAAPLHTIEVKPLAGGGALPEITIHVPTSNMQMPVQISVPHHVISTLPGGQQHITISQPSAPAASAAPASHTISVDDMFQS